MRRPARVLRLLAAVFVCLLAGWAAPLAKDVRRQWFVGGSLAYHTTTDAVANNASMEGDPRPDDYAGRELALDDTIQFGLQAGYGFTSSFSVQLDAGWFEGEAGSIDTYLTRRFPASNDPLNPYNLNITVTSETSHPFVAGRLRQIPVGLTGVWRFRKDSAFNPFVGAGAGVIFMEFEPADELFALNAEMEDLLTYSVTSETGTELIPDFIKASISDSGGRYLYSGLNYDTVTAREWHLSAGLEYAINQRVGLVAEVRYMNVGSPLKLNLNGVIPFPGRVRIVVFRTGPDDQVTYHFYPDELFRPDGSLLIYNDTRRPPNPRIPGDPNGLRYGCEAPGEGPPGGPGEVVDINSDGLLDYCYKDDDTPDDDPFGTLVVQGGELDLSGFHVHLGLRWYF
jgi:outer membrane protein W